MYLNILLLNRMFEHPLERDIKRISELSLEIQFRKRHGLSTKQL